MPDTAGSARADPAAAFAELRRKEYELLKNPSGFPVEAFDALHDHHSACKCISESVAFEACVWVRRGLL